MSVQARPGRIRAKLRDQMCPSGKQAYGSLLKGAIGKPWLTIGVTLGAFAVALFLLANLVYFLFPGITDFDLPLGRR